MLWFVVGGDGGARQVCMFANSELVPSIGQNDQLQGARLKKKLIRVLDNTSPNLHSGDSAMNLFHN